jgi:hypothetical protein
MNPAQTSRRGKIFEASNLAGGVHGVNSRSGVGGPLRQRLDSRLRRGHSPCIAICHKLECLCQSPANVILR